MPSGNNRRLERVFTRVKIWISFFVPSTNPLPWCLFRRDRRFGVMAGAHVTVVSINHLLSFHEEVCEKEQKSSQDTDVWALGPSFGGPERLTDRRDHK